jgi:nicotinamidase-related amidase
MPEQFGRVIHLCVDMQRMFTEETDWHMPWARHVMPRIADLVKANTERTIFTQFIPPQNPEVCSGSWRDYYRRWPSMTLDKLSPGMADIDPALSGFVPPARLFKKKSVYSPWQTGELHTILQGQNIRTLIISGGETDVCVLASVLGAIDLGYHIILARDALCSSSDAAHDAALDLYHRRYSVQVHPMDTKDILANY